MILLDGKSRVVADYLIGSATYPPLGSCKEHPRSSSPDILVSINWSHTLVLHLEHMIATKALVVQKREVINLFN